MFCLCDVWRRFWNLIQLLSGGLPCREVLFVISPHEGPWGFSNSRLKKFFWVWTHRSIDLFETFERLAPRTTKGLRWVRNSSWSKETYFESRKDIRPCRIPRFWDFMTLFGFGCNSMPKRNQVPVTQNWKTRNAFILLGAATIFNPTSKTPSKGWSEVQPAAHKSLCLGAGILWLFCSSSFRYNHLCTKPLGGQMFEGFWHSIQFVFECESVQAAQCCWEFQRPSLCPSKCPHFRTKTYRII